MKKCTNVPIHEPKYTVREEQHNSENRAAVLTAAAIGAQLPKAALLKGLDVVMSNRPESVPLVLRALKNEMAPKHGLAQLYKVLDGGNFDELPTPEALTFDLQSLCEVDSTPDKGFIYDALDSVSSNITRLFSSPVAQISTGIRLAELSRVLLKALGNIADHQVSTTGHLKLRIVDQLHMLFKTAVNPADQSTPMAITRNFLEAEQTRLTLAIALALVWGGVALRAFPPALQNNREVVMAAVQRDGMALQFASEELKNDREIVLAALRQNGYALQHTSIELRNDREVVLAAVNQNGLALIYASEAKQNEPEVVMAAVRQNGLALGLASHAMKNEKEIVLAAVRQNGVALAFSSEAMRDDLDVVMAAIGQFNGAAEFASTRLRNSEQFKLALIKQFFRTHAHLEQKRG